MPEQYPIPSHACTLWVSGENLMVAFPPTGPEGRGHTVKLPASAGGLQAAVDLLKQRNRAREAQALSGPGTPSQYEIERALVRDRNYTHILGKLAEGREARAAEKREAALALKELGL